MTTMKTIAAATKVRCSVSQGEAPPIIYATDPDAMAADLIHELDDEGDGNTDDVTIDNPWGGNMEAVHVYGVEDGEPWAAYIVQEDISQTGESLG